ncbi:unnamed protein product [Mytilus coruscus]|uniref:Integrase core domain-containing protein n=1 Tax=Mytilus coruscus TaxID=42192 RepID=A0A6J8AUT0_MYTCO|nr:unnamed protein product [Mytilus coruscus]
MEELLDHHCLIQQMILDGRTHQDISQHLTSLGIKHASARTISRFCSDNGITRRCGVDEGALNHIVAECVKHGSRNFNPVPYQADHFGHKIHLDQNEKLVMFGVTHVIAVDGYSVKIVRYTSMPVKNNITIYEDVYRKNEQYHNRREYQPYCQTTSIKNHRVERLWVEINNRLNFPIKRAIVQIVNNNRIDLDDDIVKYCVSSLLLNLCRIGLKTVVESWNAHPIPGI